MANKVAASNRSSGAASVSSPTGANENGFVVLLKPADVGLSRWSAVDPAQVSRAIMKKAALEMGITNDSAKADQIAARLSVSAAETKTNKGWRRTTASDYADADWMNQALDHGNNLRAQLSKQDIANLLLASKDVLGADFKSPTNVSTKQLGAWGIAITGTGLGAALTFDKAAFGTLGLAGGATVLAAGAAAIPFVVTLHDYLNEVADNATRRERVNILPIRALPRLEDDGEAPPAPSRPTATAVPQPQVQPLPNEADLPKGEIAVRPQTPPPTIAPPKVAVGELPQPYTPDAPRNLPPQLEPPRGVDPRLVLPVIIGAGALSKLAIDKLRQTVQADKAQYQQNIQKIHAYRANNNLPNYNAENGETGTVAYVKIGNQEFYGLNTGMERKLKDLDTEAMRRQVFSRVQTQLGKLQGKSYSPDGQAFTHAEAEALMLAQQHLGKMPEKVTLYVDRTTCNQCLGKNGLPLLAELYGIKELTVIDSNGRTLLVRPNEKTEIIQRQW